MVIYPLLPDGAYGPYAFFDPRQIWKFVILISSISYLGYFLEKFLGEEKGLFYTSVLGGLASTTAATMLFARESKERPEDTFGLWRAFVIANTVQFPRTFLIVVAVSPELARACGGRWRRCWFAGWCWRKYCGGWPHKQIAAVPMTVRQSIPHPACAAIWRIVRLRWCSYRRRPRTGLERGPFTGRACWAAWWTYRR